ncbi:MAG: diaminopimelate decarboxylase [Bacteroidota bacterium]
MSFAEAATPHYVYHLPTARAAARRLLDLPPTARILYALKANPHPALLRTLSSEGAGLECVSPGEVQHALCSLPHLSPSQVLFTPNFAPRSDYAWAFDQGVRVTLDNAYGLTHWPDLFAGRDIFLRIDPGEGHGHHAHVQTAGITSKFGIDLDDLPAVAERANEIGVRVTGLHAHVGSGVTEPTAWRTIAQRMREVRPLFPDVEVFDLGGGLPIPDTAEALPFDVQHAAALLGDLANELPGIELWLEPGRYLVAEAGVLLTRVTQIKRKRTRTFVGVDAGMHTLIRPALYGAFHAIVNLTRLGEPDALVADIVGPICETGDVLGHARPLPETQEGDVLLIATAGAYGQSMASRYNLREMAAESVLE